MLSPLTNDQLKAIDDVDEKFIGYVSIYDEVEIETPGHGIRRPSWFKPGGATLSDVNLAALQMRRST